MNTSSLAEAIDEILPDQPVLNDVSRILGQCPRGEIELEEEIISVPENIPITIVTKVFLKEYFEDVGFGAYRVQVAIGGIENKEFGILSARFCFATLYYNEEPSLITIDFHKKMR